MDKSTAVRSMVFGGIMFMVGLMLTVSAYATPEPNNGVGRTVVAVVAMIFGGLRFGYGVVKLSRANRA